MIISDGINKTEKYDETQEYGGFEKYLYFSTIQIIVLTIVMQ